MKFTLAIAASILAFTGVQATPVGNNLAARNNGGYDTKEHKPEMTYGDDKKDYGSGDMKDYGSGDKKEQDAGKGDGKDDGKADGKDDLDYGMSSFPFKFTSTYEIHAVPEEVVDSNNQPTGGVPGTSGKFLFGINSKEDYICYNIELFGYPEGFEYSSPANTATHIHEAPRGQAGPPRLAFKNPEYGANGKLQSVGCLKGPYKTGVLTDAGVDTGDGFTVKQIEDNPAGFFTDNHVAAALPGAVRGQLSGDNKSDDSSAPAKKEDGKDDKDSYAPAAPKKEDGKDGEDSYDYED